METVKLYKAGTSIVAVIPKNYLKTLGWQPGERVSVILESSNKISFVKLQESDKIFKLSKPITPLKKEVSHEADNLNTTR